MKFCKRILETLSLILLRAKLPLRETYTLLDNKKIVLIRLLSDKVTLGGVSL